jgi:prepilin-type N-terminal cleavage/methylation domain-containing protein
MKKHKAYTFLELIIAMAVVAILLGLGFAGITSVQRSSRNTQRRKSLEAIHLAVQSFKGTFGQYPARIDTFAATKEVRLCSVATSQCPAQTTGTNYVITTKIATPPDTTSATSTADATAYCYTTTLTAFYLAVGLEGGGSHSYSFGGLTPCTPDNTFATDNIQPWP